MALPIERRLKKELDFKRVLKTGNTYRGILLFIKYTTSPNTPSRFGITVSAKISKKAVVRNRIRRLLSETIQAHALSKTSGYDTVVVVTKQSLLDLDAYRKDLLSVLDQVGII